MAEDSSNSVTGDQYGDRVAQLNSAGVGAAGSSAVDPGSSGSLPFTGLDLGLMVAAAGGLLVGGVAIRRRSRAEADV